MISREGSSNGRLRRTARVDIPRLYAAEELALRIERHIVSGGLPPGSRLGTKAEIRDRYEFAGGTVNEAVILLETRGMVEARPGPGGGLFVAAPTPRARLDLLLRELLIDSPSVADCWDLCRDLELAVCSDAARNCKATDASELRTELELMRRTGAATSQLALLAMRLHRRIAAMTTNSLLRVVYLLALGLLEEAGGQTSKPCSLDRAEVIEVHEELVEALISGAPDRLVHAVERHERHARASALQHSRNPRAD
jgi:DNA-binding FadR family transcriptional regulator